MPAIISVLALVVLMPLVDGVVLVAEFEAGNEPLGSNGVDAFAPTTPRTIITGSLQATEYVALTVALNAPLACAHHRSSRPCPLAVN
jgi:hypothetical protein